MRTLGSWTNDNYHLAVLPPGTFDGSNYVIVLIVQVMDSLGASSWVSKEIIVNPFSSDRRLLSESDKLPYEEYIKTLP